MVENCTWQTTQKNTFDCKQIGFSFELQIQPDLPQFIQGVSLQRLKSHKCLCLPLQETKQQDEKQIRWQETKHDYRTFNI